MIRAPTSSSRPQIFHSPSHKRSIDNHRFSAFQRRHTHPPKLKEFGFLKTFDDVYALGELLGTGSFSTVSTATHRSSGDSFAVKTMRKKTIGNILTDYFTKHVHHEVDILSRLGPSLNIAYLYGVYEDEKYVRLVMEHCKGGPVWTRVRNGTYSEQDAARIVKDILRAVVQCHSKNIVIRDVKPDNFLFLDTSERSPLKAIDFGLAQYCSPTDVLEDRAGTPMYIAPEVLRRNYGQKADMWSVGVVAYQLLTGRMPFLDEDGYTITRSHMERHLFSNKDMFRAVLHSKLDYSKDTWNQLSDASKHFVKHLLKRDPKHRMTAEEALEHDWVREGITSSASSHPLGQSIVQRLQRFGTYGKLKQAALKRLASFVADDPVLFKNLKSGFLQLDTNGTGKVSKEEIRQMIRNGKFDMAPTEMQQLLKQLEVDEHGSIDYTTWLAAIIDWRQLQECPVWDTWIQEVFQQFDADHRGQLTPEELTQVLCGGETCEIPDTVPSVLRDVDTNGDGLVSFEEFVQIMKSERSDKLELFDGRV